MKKAQLIELAKELEIYTDDLDTVKKLKIAIEEYEENVWNYEEVEEEKVEPETPQLKIVMNPETREIITIDANEQPDRKSVYLHQRGIPFDAD